VKNRLPEVRVLQWPADLAGGGLDDLGLFDTLRLTDEDRRRTELYQAESQRRAARDEATSIDDYLGSLEMVAVVGLARPDRLPRLAQLTQRTNQFNLTTRRYDLAALEQMMQAPDTRLIWLELSDRFGKYGMVGCGIVCREEDGARIDTLLMSCRIIGRGAEAVLLNRLGILAREMGATSLVGEYIPTARNAQVADFYTRMGFTGPDDDGMWRWDLSDGPPPASESIEIADFETEGH
jgi:FkbH-like protein